MLIGILNEIWANIILLFKRMIYIYMSVYWHKFVTLLNYEGGKRALQWDLPSYRCTYTYISYIRASLVAQKWRTCLPLQEIRVRFLAGEDSLEKEMTTPSSILAWKIPGETGRLPEVQGPQRVRRDSRTQHSVYLNASRDCFIA